ncbi:hypothetical protein MRX96_048062 [Rhipicephalus microplus]
MLAGTQSTWGCPPVHIMGLGDGPRAADMADFQDRRCAIGSSSSTAIFNQLREALPRRLEATGGVGTGDRGEDDQLRQDRSCSCVVFAEPRDLVGFLETVHHEFFFTTRGRPRNVRHPTEGLNKDWSEIARANGWGREFDDTQSGRRCPLA